MSLIMWTITSKAQPIKGETYTIKDKDGFFVRATYNGSNFVCKRGKVRSGSIWYYSDYNGFNTHKNASEDTQGINNAQE